MREDKSEHSESNAVRGQRFEGGWAGKGAGRVAARMCMSCEAHLQNLEECQFDCCQMLGSLAWVCSGCHSQLDESFTKRHPFFKPAMSNYQYFCVLFAVFCSRVLLVSKSAFAEAVHA